MKASEQNQLMALGQLRSAQSIMKQIASTDTELVEDLIIARDALDKAILYQWGKCSELLTEDDT